MINRFEVAFLYILASGSVFAAQAKRTFDMAYPSIQSIIWEINHSIEKRKQSYRKF
jgi:hypothetical protein